LLHLFLLLKYRYTRNLIDIGNGKFNLILICWAETIGSRIHDHHKSQCFVKILDGELTETIYQWPDDGVEQELLPIKTKTCRKNEVTYIDG
jgi:cysteine dioxygenase